MLQRRRPTVQRNDSGKERTWGWTTFAVFARQVFQIGQKVGR